MTTKKAFFNWTGFWAQKLISATIEDGAASDVVLTFVTLKPHRKSVAGEFTIATKTVNSIARVEAANTLTVTVTMPWNKAAGNPTITFTPTFVAGQKGHTVSKVVTNNLSA
jgi:hypothetical protein